jgi:hypothetical protein
MSQLTSTAERTRPPAATLVLAPLLAGTAVGLITLKLLWLDDPVVVIPCRACKSGVFLAASQPSLPIPLHTRDGQGTLGRHSMTRGSSRLFWHVYDSNELFSTLFSKNMRHGVCA